MQALTTSDYRGAQTWQDIRHIEEDEESYPLCVLLFVIETGPLLTVSWHHGVALLRSKSAPELPPVPALQRSIYLVCPSAISGRQATVLLRLSRRRLRRPMVFTKPLDPETTTNATCSNRVLHHVLRPTPRLANPSKSLWAFLRSGGALNL